MARRSRGSASKALIAFARGGATIEDIDTSFVPDSDFDGLLDGPRPASVIAEHAANEFSWRFIAGADCLKPNRKQERALRAIIGKGGMPARMLVSCIPTQLRFFTELTDQWRNHWHQHRREPGRQYMFVTIITDSGNALARRPRINLEALRRRADKILRSAHLHGNFVIELQLVTNFPRRGDGGTHCWHVHFIGTTDDPACDVGSLQSALRKSGRLSNVFNAPTVTITPITSLAQLMRCCAYMLKAPAVGKFLRPHPRIPNAWTFDKVFVRKDEALRLGEALSQVELGQVVHSVCEGKHLLRPAMKAVRAWHKAQYAKAKNKLPEDFVVAKFWAGLRGSGLNNLNRPYIFRKPRDGCHFREWMKVALPALTALNTARERASAPKAPRVRSTKTKARSGVQKSRKWRRGALDRVQRPSRGP